MHLRYETGVATLVQFIVAIFLSFLSGGVSIVGNCHASGVAECVGNTFVSLVLIILTVIWFGFLLGLGYITQERRSTRLALTLIGVEGVSAFVYLFDIKHSPSHVEQLTNFILLLLAGWVIVLAWRLSRAKGGRIVKTARTRRRSVASH